MDNMELAISKAELAVSATPEDHSDRARRLNNLGIMLFYRYNQTGNMDDLDTANSRLELAVSITPKEHPDQAERLGNLGNMLSYQYNQTGDMDNCLDSETRAFHHSEASRSSRKAK